MKFEDRHTRLMQKKRLYYAMLVMQLIRHNEEHPPTKNIARGTLDPGTLGQGIDSRT